MKGLLIAAGLVVVCVACSPVGDTPIPADISAWDKELSTKIQKLADEDKAALQAYLVRVKLGEVFGGKGIPPGTTIKSAIAEQKTFQQRRAAEEAEAKALAAKLQQDRAASLEAMRSAVTVALVEKQLDVKRGYSGIETDRGITVKFAYKNNTQKTISGVKGMITVVDLFGDEISGFAISNDESIAPGATSIWVGSRSVKFAIGSSNKDEKLAELTADKYTVKWEPAVIVFADGTRMGASR